MDITEDPRRRSPAFSLIELLVTIAIIAVLIGILLPALGPARDSARRVACGVQLRSVAEAMEMYKTDNREEFPIARYMPRPWLSGFDGVTTDEQDINEITLPPLPVAIEDYIPEPSESWVCPGDNIVAETTWEDENGDIHESGASYTYVTALAGREFDETFFVRFLRMGPSTTPISYDFDGGTFETTDGREIFVDFFHRTRNVLFVDGHIGKYESTGAAEGPSSEPASQ